MYYLLFLLPDDNYFKQAQINEVIYAQLPIQKPDLDDFLIKSIKTYMIYGSCDIINPEYVCIKDKNDKLRH